MPHCSTTRRMPNLPTGASIPRASLAASATSTRPGLPTISVAPWRPARSTWACLTTPAAGKGSAVAPTVWAARPPCRARAIVSRVPVAAPFRAATGRSASTTSGTISTRTARRSAVVPCPCGMPRTWRTPPAWVSPPCRATVRPGVWIPTTRLT